MFKQFQDTFTFDDVLLVPQKSEILPKDVKIHTYLTREIKLNAPFLSAPMDTVTEHEMAIKMALAGGIGIIHKNLSIDDQVAEIRKVKRFENGFVKNPMTAHPSDPMSKIIQIRNKFGYKKVPIVDNDGVLVGFISDIDYLMLPDNDEHKVLDFMFPVQKMNVGYEGMSLKEAYQMIQKFRLRTLCIVDKNNKLVSIVTRRDLEKSLLYPNSSKDSTKQLLVGGAIGVGINGIERAENLLKAGTDVLIVDTAHGHSRGVIDTVKEIKRKWSGVQVIAGNIASSDAAKDLIDAGVDALKVGIGPGSICTTRIVAGIGVPQLSAIMEVVKGVYNSQRKVPVIADGGIKSSGDVVKALAVGAMSVMMGNMFAGTDESPGRIEYTNGRMYKVYRGMGSIDAMEFGSKDRYGQAEIKEKQKFVPEGVSGRVAYKGSVSTILYQLEGGLRSGFGYNGARNISELQKRAHFVKITGSSLKESHPHDLKEVSSAPNYSID
ncbi:MAG: IMP dehydrogenase [Candidatus Magasanikbacteria bacterium RIFCSPHIGHO2_01_FULL_33_34]|uniref:Inosine-5'-monophosphate dehydrogenase n=1 Tax=Candidatus Magasanikbacteria bacterium RIFCSPHIGHO2_01_FULL_33_34 TaxID=1798671 RepID=A0A1F6LI13_9BACT|nr:MAG: IMP dehydrogenase [Candidatus Magasanikbacteria bacterium RIFCSPHIGHO2_01_FULL_33_34]OGH65226.1 MAG: IMP dehydrogenase [Candidatus Magasanikbacteria bacterium RIFCSPHIGHO2_02_FULL_33_17]OGH75369.1 MAG: IMP dehydrogenase [Candidatus Magasanikbacteria bacterium RIFCSPLOWO2_01_FULL_33_34]